MLDLITEGRHRLSLLERFTSTKTGDDSYDIKFDEGPPYYGKSIKGAKWRTFRGNRVIVNPKNSKVYGVPKDLEKSLDKGDKDDEPGSLDLDNKPTKQGEAPKDTDAEAQKDFAADDEAAAEGEKDAVAELDKMPHDKALDHLEKNMDDMPVSTESAKGGGILGFIAKMIGKLAGGLIKAFKKGGGLIKKIGKKAGAKAKETYKHYRDTTHEERKAQRQLDRAHKLYTKQQKRVNKQLTKEYRLHKSIERTQEKRDALKAREAEIDKLKASVSKKTKTPWSSQGKMKAALATSESTKRYIQDIEAILYG